MPRAGFSGTKPDMKKLILYILGLFPCDRETLGEICLLETETDYFVFSAAYAELESYITPDGRLTDEGAKLRLVTPPTPSVRRAADAEIRARETVRRRNACLQTETSPLHFTGTLTDGNALLFSLTLAAPNEFAARDLARSFRKTAESLYGEILQKLTENEQ